jgi:alpha-tubulin suppressor-like RCC1 family protein
MSYRYPAAFIKPGLNTLVQGAPIYTYYLNTWGYHSEGALGLGNRTTYSSPKQVGALTNWLQVVGSYAHTIAIKTDGTLWTWGYNSSGQLGLGNTTSYSSPKQVGALTTWAYVGTSSDGSYGASYAIKTDGTLWSWGSNANGRLGLNNTTSYSSPKQVGALTNWLKVTSGSYTNFAVAIKTDGTMWSWGANNYGQLGISLPTYYSRSSPVQIGALTTWANVSIGFNFAMAIKTDGTLWAWGDNSYGQQGLGNTSSRSSPIQVGALTSWSRVSCGFQSDGGFTQAVRTNGTLWSWGWNRAGQLGLNFTNYNATISSPNQVGSLTNWSNVSCGNQHTIALKTDGTLWSWGVNNLGQLGQNNTTTLSSPVQIGALTTWYATATGNKYSIALAY